MVQEVHGEYGLIFIHCPLCTCICSQSYDNTHALSEIISLLLSLLNLAGDYKKVLKEEVSETTITA